jgi:nicotinamide-nucleotide adenylyltransferase
MKALFIGRFQPFHNGHLKIIYNLIEKYNEIIIGVGSSQYGYTLENPFTFKERKLMIEETFGEMNFKNYKIIELPDIHNYPKWVDHVIGIVPDFDVIISNNPLTKRLFSEKSYKVEETPLFNRKEYSGKEIRKKIVYNERWKKLLPEPVKNIIIKIDGISRLKELSEK